MNPASGRGRGARKLAAVRAAFDAAGGAVVRTTTTVENEGILTRRAIEEGCTTLVAVGGDGTWSNVANALLHTRADVRLALVAAGTGNDFAKSAGVPASDIAETTRLCFEGGDTRIDVGRVEDRFFLNAFGAGFDVAVLERCARTRWLRGDALYLYSAVRELRGYRGVDVALAPADQAQRHLLLVVANGGRFGGSFRIAPQASLKDGLLDVVAIRNASTLRRARLFAAAVRGTHGAEPDVEVSRRAELRMTFAAPPAYEVDGEYCRASSDVLDVRCVPSALRLVGGIG